VIAAAVATAGFWTYQLIWSEPQPSRAITSDSTADAETKLKAAEIEQQRLQEEVQSQAKAATELQTKLQAAQAEQQRLKEEVERQTKAAADADTKLKASQTEQQRLRDEVARLNPSATGLFTIKTNTEAFRNAGTQSDYVDSVSSTAACEERCKEAAFCNAFAYNKRSSTCFRYSSADLKPNPDYESGIRK
jgi:chromosome segregation ATPase